LLINYFSRYWLILLPRMGMYWTIFSLLTV